MGLTPAERATATWEEMHLRYPAAVEEILSDMRKRSGTEHKAEYEAPFGVEGCVEVDEAGICRYEFNRTGYDGLFCIEGRCYARDAERMVSAFLDVAGAAKAYEQVMAVRR